MKPKLKDLAFSSFLIAFIALCLFALAALGAGAAHVLSAASPPPPLEGQPLLLLRTYTATNYAQGVNAEWQRFEDEHGSAFPALNPFLRIGNDYKRPFTVTNYVFGVRIGTNTLELFERVYSDQFIAIRPL